AGSYAMPTVLTNTPACPTSVNPTLVGYVPAVGIAKDVAVDSTRGVAYVASTEFGISTVNVSNPSNPVAIGGAIPPFDGEELAVSGSLGVAPVAGVGDRKSTRLNSSHVSISYAVFCLKKKK